MEFYDVKTGKVGGLETLFPGWKGSDERVCVYSPHDDDAIIGAGYAMRAAMDAGAEVHVLVACDGACGYSTPEEKPGIVERRRRRVGMLTDRQRKADPRAALLLVAHVDRRDLKRACVIEQQERERADGAKRRQNEKNGKKRLPAFAADANRLHRFFRPFPITPADRRLLGERFSFGTVGLCF